MKGKKMFLKTITQATLLSAGLATATMASTAGQPFLIADDDLNGSVLNYFDVFGPTGVRVLNLSGTITEAIGAPGLVGEGIAFDSGLADFTNEASFTLGTTVSSGFDISNTGPGLYDYDGFVPGPGDLNLTFLVFPTFTDQPNASDPTLYDFFYTGDYEDFPDKIGADFPEIELMMSVYLDGPLPMKTYEETDPVTGNVTFTFDYVEGPLSVERITVGLVGGEPVPSVPPIPLPAGFPLLIGGLGLLVMVRKRSSAA